MSARCDPSCGATITKVGTNAARFFHVHTSRRAQRDRFRALAVEADIAVQIHAIDAPRELRRERVRERNRGGATYTVEVDDAMFDWAEGYYEPLDTDERLGAVVPA